ncbi:MAG: hypothetical protein AB8B55_14245 [Mariniblastus sp.]
MILSNSRIRKNTTRFWQFCVALFALLIVPLGMTPLQSANAQDLEAVQKRLARSIKHNELTIIQAAVMMEALREHLEEEHQNHEGEHRERYEEEEEVDFDDERVEKYRERERALVQAVENGRISEQDAERRLIDFRRELWNDNDGKEVNREARNDQRMNRFHLFERQMRENVESGMISEKEAEQRIRDLRKKMKDAQASTQQSDVEEMYRQAAVKLRKAVESGELSGKDARLKLQAYKEELAGGNDEEEMPDNERAMKERWAGFERRIKAAVESGDMSREEAKEAFEKAKQRMARMERSQSEQERERVNEARDVKEHNERRMSEEARTKLAAMRLRVKTAVESGRITREQGDKALEDLHRRMELLHREMESREKNGQHEDGEHDDESHEDHDEDGDDSEHEHGHDDEDHELDDDEKTVDDNR